MTTRQQKVTTELFAECKISSHQQEVYLQEKFGVFSLNELSVNQSIDLFDQLKRVKRNQRSANSQAGNESTNTKILLAAARLFPSVT